MTNNRVLYQITRSLSVKSQVTLPQEVRDALGIMPYDQVVFEISDNQVALKPLEMSLETTFGAVSKLKNHYTFKEQRDIAIDEHIENKFKK